MARTLSILILSILVSKIKSQAIEVNTNLQYSQFSYPSGLQFQTPPSQPIPSPSVPVNFPAQPPQIPVTLPPQPCISAPVTQPSPPVSITLPTQPYIPPPTVTLPPPISIPFPQPVFQPIPIQPPTFPAPLPTFQVSPPPVPIFTPPVYVSPPPPIAIQEIPVNIPAVLPTVIPSPVVISPSQIPMISTTVVDNSLANKLANVLELFLVSKTIGSNITPYCNSPYYSDVTPFGTIGTAYSPLTEVVTAPFYAPAYELADIGVPSIFGVESYGAVTEVYPVGNIGAVSEVISFGDYYNTSPFTQLAYNLPQIVEPALEPILYY